MIKELRKENFGEASVLLAECFSENEYYEGLSKNELIQLFSSILNCLSECGKSY
jgi:hypothetical protein